ncbi:MAG TPA: hypothetical protein VFQ61_27965, partial [Polyangiaceae bacterium]|nr:hypothetical protein [Polyangiaceae bacterium]
AGSSARSGGSPSGGALARGGAGAGGKSTTGTSTASSGSGGSSSGEATGTGATTSSAGASTSGGQSGVGGVAATGGAPSSGGTGPDCCNSEGGAGGSSDRGPLDGSSWDVHLAIELTSRPSNPVDCSSADLTAHFAARGERLSLIAGRDGLVDVGELEEATGPSPDYTLVGPLTFPTRGDCALEWMDVKELVLRALDEDADGTPDAIEGEGKATSAVVRGDVVSTVQLSFVLRGHPDAQSPTLLMPLEHHPLDLVNLPASEPIALSSVVGLNLTTGARAVPLQGKPVEEVAFSAFSAPDILDFGSRWRVSPGLQDLAGLRLDSNTPQIISVLADPGEFAQDGFEAAPVAHLTGSAQIVTGVGSVPALSGQRSLFVPEGSTATLHLRRAAREPNLRFTARSFSIYDANPRNVPIDIGVIWGKQRFRAEYLSGNSDFTATGDSKWSSAGPSREYSVAIGETGSDVIVRVAPRVCETGMCPPPQAWLVDDVRLAD